jgi:hypothetical protein
MTQRKLIGIIVFLIAIFPLGYAHFLAGSPGFWIWGGIVMSLWVFDVLFSVAWKLFFPKKEEDVKEQ